MIVKNFAIFVVSTYARLFYHHKVYGQEHMVKGGAIVASNHVSYLDPPLIGVSTKEEVHFLARSTLFRYFGFGWLLRQLHSHPVKRGQENASIFRLMLSLLRDEKKVAVFPEGKRSTDGGFIQPEAGIGVLVLHAHVPVIPTYVHGTYDIWGAHRGHPKATGHTAVVFGSALDFSNLNIADRKEAQLFIAVEVMKAIRKLQDWYLAGAQGSPP